MVLISTDAALLDQSGVEHGSVVAWSRTGSAAPTTRVRRWQLPHPASPPANFNINRLEGTQLGTGRSYALLPRRAQSPPSPPPPRPTRSAATSNPGARASSPPRGDSGRGTRTRRSVSADARSPRTFGASAAAAGAARRGEATPPPRLARYPEQRHAAPRRAPTGRSARAEAALIARLARTARSPPRTRRAPSAGARYAAAPKGGSARRRPRAAWADARPLPT